MISTKKKASQNRKINLGEEEITVKINRDYYRKFKMVCLAKNISPKGQINTLVDQWVIKNIKAVKDV